MKTDKLFEPLVLNRGPAMKNRFMLAPLTNQQSHADGRLSDNEFNWLTKRAEGGFGYVMTAASHIQVKGQGFPGQLGVFGDEHLEGLTRLASRIKADGAVSGLQLHHAGNRSPADLVTELVCPSDDPETGARGLTLSEVHALRDDFIAAALRSEKAGFDGIEIHGAHGYIIAQFLSPDLNHRKDEYGGDVERRSRILFEIIDGIRASCGPDFQIGLRMSAERFGLKLAEMRAVAAEVLHQQKIDYFELSAWDIAKEPVEEEFQGRTLLSYFTELPRGDIRLGAAGKIMGAQTAAQLLEDGCDFAVIGRGAILRHDFPERVRADETYTSPALPVTADHLRAEGLSDSFVEYMSGWKGFVAHTE